MAGQTTNYLFDYPTSTDYVKDGATAIETLADDVDATLFTALGGAYPGLRLIKTQTVGTGVSSVNITAAFSATYVNYLVIYTGGTGNNNYFSLRIGNVATANYYNTGQSYSYSTSAPTQAGAAAATGHNNINYMTSSGGAVRCEIMQPFLSTLTYISTLGIEATASGSGGVYERKGILNTTASYTSFDFVSNGTMTGGTIYVYGYGAS
jgi:hypothetical protein